MNRGWRNPADEVALLCERVEELERLLGIKLPKPCPFSHIRPRSWQLLGLLLRAKGHSIPRDFAYAALYSGMPEVDQPKDIRVIDQRICRLTRELAQFDIEISTEIGVGYYLTEQALTRLEEHINGVGRDDQHRSCKRKRNGQSVAVVEGVTGVGG